ncbi:T9SS type A sorting domain-containing protein [Aequorivita sp. SDUM287046]|uniref:T9SS type A sorting domain-containing protein n=1 Tax=Aequorivita aurantiaca TaxID=3053356 RepID=A0ABT8DJ26_9FLAO|nr:T9SS type A sorting domain-containing protein [Aequorivita aurantiaca]MDN3724799.1 T9SS type A sorting domain-containing protein [Aequorivita aurantiaca]
MKNFTSYFSLFLFLFSFCLTAQSFQWGGTFGGFGEDVVRDMHTDASGNTYTTGYFTDVADFDISAAEANLISNGLYDLFVLKTNSAGNYEWAINIGSESFEYGVGITTDADGNVYVTGYYDGTADFDPGVGETILTSLGGGDIFILKLNADGEFLWAKSVGGTDYEESTAIAVSPTGIVTVIGYFYEPADFNPGPDEFILTSEGASDTFLLNLDQDGTFISAQRYGGPDLDLALDMKVNSAGHLYITGYFEGTSDFDPRNSEEFNLTSSTEGFSSYLLHINNTGELVSAGATHDGLAEVRAIAVDANDNIYLTGHFGGTVNFSFDAANTDYILTSELAYNAFAMKINPMGILEWAKSIESNEAVFGYDVTVDAAGHVFTTGYFAATADFDPDSSATFNLNKQTANATDAYIWALDTDGNFINAFTFGGANFLDAHTIGIDGQGFVYLSGHFETTVDINPLEGETLEATALDFRDNYIIKMAATTLGVPSNDYEKITVFPNPVGSVVYVGNTQNMLGKSYLVYDALGRIVLSGSFDNAAQVNMETLSSGIYYLNIAGHQTIKLIKN